MTPGATPRAPSWVAELLRSAGMARAFTLASLGSVFAAVLLERMTGVVVYTTFLGGLVVVGIGMLIARRREISLLRLVPTSLVAYLLWTLTSLFWSTDRTRTLGGWLTIAALAFVAIVIAHVRDTLQTVRALADVMRWLLSVSLGLEVLSGILLDIPLPFLGVQGNLAAFGPVQGIFGTRNMLGFVAVIALVTFLVEWRTNSVAQGLSLFSVVLAGGLAVLSDSPTVLVLAVVVALTSGALVLVRNTPAESRAPLQWTISGVVVVGLGMLYAFRFQVIGILGAASDFYTRTELWRTLFVYVDLRPIQGWGWFGPWSATDLPFDVVNATLDDQHASALNAYVDVLLQVGWVGVLLFLAFAGIALVRSWLVASARRSIVYAWTPLVLVTLLVDSMFESFTLHGLGWLMLVVCAVRAGQSRSWRERIDAIDAGPELPHVQGR